MRKFLFIAVMAAAVAVAGLAYAQDADDTVTLTSSAPSGGKKSKPKPVAPTFSATLSGPGGVRAKTPKTHSWYWTGIKEYGKYFPKCTADEIDAAQSDSVCDPKALVAEGTIVAKLGPEGQLEQNTNCNKSLRYYNEGAGKMNLYAYGPAEECAGVGYLPPIPITWKKKGTSSEQVLEFPQNIAHPLPGIEGGFAEFEVTFKNVTKKVKLPGIKKKVKIGYLSSVGCKGKRSFTFTSVPEVGTQNVQTVEAGSC
jgi:hypothetical protein